MFTSNGLLRKGIEAEFWVLRKNHKGYVFESIRDNTNFLNILNEVGGDLEYAKNQFELRTLPGFEENNTCMAEKGLTERLNKLRTAIPSDCLIVSSGTYQGNDEPLLDLNQNQDKKGPNNFWVDFRLGFPEDEYTRFTIADQVNISLNDNEENLINVYNRIAGLSPLFIYAFSTSSVMNGVSIQAWNRRMQFVNGKGIRAGAVIKGTYPLKDINQYNKNLEELMKEVEEVLKTKNELFFGESPRDVVADYRDSMWGFVKLCTDQNLRFNRGTSNSFLETRCIDAQECIKMKSALSYLSETVFYADKRLEKLLPVTEEELIKNNKQAILYGDKGIIIINGEEISISEYTKQISDILFGENPQDKYAKLLKDRFLSPPAKRIREIVSEGKDFVKILDMCLKENKTIYEVTE